jgi:hypothetical protein
MICYTVAKRHLIHNCPDEINYKNSKKAAKKIVPEPSQQANMLRVRFDQHGLANCPNKRKEQDQ